MYGIGNERAPAIVMYSNVLKHSPRILSAHKELVKGRLSKSFVKSVDEEPSDSKQV